MWLVSYEKLFHAAHTTTKNNTQVKLRVVGVAQKIVTAQPTSDLVMICDIARVSDVELVPRGRVKRQ